MNKDFNHNYFTVTAKLIFMGFEFLHEVDNNTEEWINHSNGNVFQIRKTDKHFSQKELSKILLSANISFDKFYN